MPLLQSEQLVAGLSNLRKSPECLGHVFVSLDVSNSDLDDITLISTHKFLQNVNLEGNQLKDVKSLGDLLHLTRLNLAKNQLTELLDFEPPRALREVDYSDNAVRSPTETYD